MIVATELAIWNVAMTEVIASLSAISARYDAVFCDLWGCLHNGKAAFPAAVSALQAFRAKGGKVVEGFGARGTGLQSVSALGHRRLAFADALVRIGKSLFDKTLT